MTLLRHIAACNTHSVSAFLPFRVAGQGVGWVRPTLARRLAADGRVFALEGSRESPTLVLSDRLASPEARTRAVAEVAAGLADDGVLPQPVGEIYRVARTWGDPTLMLLDRALVPTFGIRAYGVHLNGYVDTPQGPRMWIGRRSPDRAVAPGKLDNLVGGGQPAGLGLRANLIKECDEEAGLPRALAEQARAVGALTYCLETPAGLRPDTLFVYDLALPAEFTPRNRDGEITEFQLWPFDKVLETLRETESFKFNVPLTLIDFALRHGMIDPDRDPDYLDLVGGLRRPLPLPEDPTADHGERGRSTAQPRR